MTKEDIFRDEKGRFIKGIPKPFSNKGKHWELSNETKQKIGKALEGMNNPNYGKTFSETHTKKLSEAHMGKHHMKETRIKISQNNARHWDGKKFSVDHRRKISETRKNLFKKGELKSQNYIDGRSKLLAPGRYGDDWDKIRYMVYIRDRFTCQHCGVQGKRLDVHHKIPFLVSFDNSLNNLITLCRACHMKEEKRLIKQIAQEVLI